MRSRLVLFLLVFISASALAQREGEFEVAMGIGKDLVPPPGVFKSDRNLSASICYNLTNEWGVVFYVDQQDYRLDHLTSEHEHFLDYRTPTLVRTVTSLLIGGRYFVPNKSKVLNPYVSLALGYAKSVSSPDGYYVVSPIIQDTSFNRVQSGHFFLGLVSLGIQVRPVSFFDLFAELQTSVPSSVDLSPGPIACRIGIGVIF